MLSENLHLMKTSDTTLYKTKLGHTIRNIAQALRFIQKKHFPYFSKKTCFDAHLKCPKLNLCIKILDVQLFNKHNIYIYLFFIQCGVRSFAFKC